MSRGILSAILVFHLCAVLIGPNRESYFSTRFQSVFEPYLNFLELGSRWNFFSPDPGPPPFFVEWEVLDRDERTVASGKLPEMPDPFFLRERQNRRIAAARLLYTADSRGQSLIAPHLCGRFPTARSVRIWKILWSPVSLQDVAAGKSQVSQNRAGERTFLFRAFCEGAA